MGVIVEYIYFKIKMKKVAFSPLLEFWPKGEVALEELSF
jgi:hypothetical protein